MKRLILVVLLIKSSLLLSQSLSINSPENYFKEPFGEFASGNEEKEILKIVDRFMLAVNTKDKEIFNKILYKGINRIVTNIENDNSVITSVIDNDQSIAMRMNPNNKEQFRERYWDAKIITDGNIATVWAPYDFYLNDSSIKSGDLELAEEEEEGAFSKAATAKLNKEETHVI